MNRILIQELILNNELKKAIEALISHAELADLREWKHALIDLGRRYRDNSDRRRKNLLTSEEWSVNESQIADALLNALDHIEEGTPGPTATERQALQEALPEVPRTRFRTFAGVSLALAQVFGLLGVGFFWDMGSMPNGQFGLAALIVLILPTLVALLIYNRLGRTNRSTTAQAPGATPLQAFLFLLVVIFYLLGVLFFLYQKAVGGLFGDGFYAMQIAIGIWCLLFGAFAGYWLHRLFAR